MRGVTVPDLCSSCSDGKSFMSNKYRSAVCSADSAAAIPSPETPALFATRKKTARAKSSLEETNDHTDRQISAGRLQMAAARKLATKSVSQFSRRTRSINAPKHSKAHSASAFARNTIKESKLRDFASTLEKCFTSSHRSEVQILRKGCNRCRKPWPALSLSRSW